jgi:hypothetical protein
MRLFPEFHPEFHPGVLNAKCGTSLKSETPHSTVVPETGLEPVRGCPQRFLRLRKGCPKPSAYVQDRFLVTNPTPGSHLLVHQCPPRWL